MFSMNDRLLPKHDIVEHEEEERGSLNEIFEGDYFRVTILLIQVSSSAKLLKTSVLLLHKVI